MEDLTEAQQQKALQNFVYRKNYYNQYQKENRDKCVLSSKKYFDSLMNDEESRIQEIEARLLSTSRKRKVSKTDGREEET